MDEKYVDQSVRDLNLCVYPGIPEIGGTLHIFREHNVEPFPGVHVRLGIVGESHFFSLRIPEEQFGFTELLACTEPPAFGGIYVAEPLLRVIEEGKPGFLENILFLFDYSFIGEVREATAETLQRVAAFRDELLLGRLGEYYLRVGISHDFSSLAGNEAGTLPFSPETLVALNVAWGCARFTLATVHTYPNERKIVFTESELRRK